MKLDKVQWKCTLICRGALSRTSSIKLLSDLGWTSLEERRRVHGLSVMHKYIIM